MAMGEVEGGENIVKCQFNEEYSRNPRKIKFPSVKLVCWVAMDPGQKLDLI